MIEAAFFFSASAFLSLYLLRLLYVAATRRHVIALSRTIYDEAADPGGGPGRVVETPQTMAEKPIKFWANVVVAILLLPLALYGVVSFGSKLWPVISD